MRQNRDRTGILKVDAINGLPTTALIAGKWFKQVVQSILIPARAHRRQECWDQTLNSRPAMTIELPKIDLTNLSACTESWMEP